MRLIAGWRPDTNGWPHSSSRSPVIQAQCCRQSQDEAFGVVGHHDMAGITHDIPLKISNIQGRREQWGEVTHNQRL